MSEENMEQAAAENAQASNTKDRKKKPRKKRRWIKRLILTLVILCALGLWGWSTYTELQAEYTVTYDPYVATTGSISNSLSFTGTMQLVNSATYTAPENVKVREVYVSLGDTVKDGDKLIRLSNGNTIEAEFDGTVTALEAAKGDEVSSGATLATVADFDHMKVSVRVGESDIASVAVGQSCRVTVSSAGATYDSEISKIDYVSYTGNNVAYYTTTVNVDTSGTENIYPGMQATVTVPLEEANDVIVLKMDALSTARDNTAFVYKEAADGSMEAVKVTVGVSNGNYVEIKEGIEDGETVYAVAEQEEELTGLASLFSSLFSRQRVNRPSGMGSGGSMPGSGSFSFDSQNGSFPSGNFPSGGFGGGSSGGGSGGGGFGGGRGN